MELNIRDIVDAEKVLETIAFDKNIKGRYSLKLLKNFENLKKEVDRFDSVREPILIKYCDKDEKNKPIIEDNHYLFSNTENREKMAKELNELLLGAVNVDIDLISPLAFEDVNISIAQLSQIRFMLEMEEKQDGTDC